MIMAGTDETVNETERVIQHLEAALETEEMDEVDYHLRHALQLLGIDE